MKEKITKTIKTLKHDKKLKQENSIFCQITQKNMLKILTRLNTER